MFTEDHYLQLKYRVTYLVVSFYYFCNLRKKHRLKGFEDFFTTYFIVTKISFLFVSMIVQSKYVLN